MFCENCGAQIADNAKFCETCGTQTTAEQAAIQAQHKENVEASIDKGYGGSWAITITMVVLAGVFIVFVGFDDGEPEVATWTAIIFGVFMISLKWYYEIKFQKRWRREAREKAGLLEKAKADEKAPYETGGKKGVRGFLAWAAAAVLVAAGIYFVMNMPPGPGAPVPVQNSKIEFEDAYLDFGNNKIPDGGATMTEILPVKKQKVEGLVSGLYELELAEECGLPVTLKITVDDSKRPVFRPIFFRVGNNLKKDGGRGDKNALQYKVKHTHGLVEVTFTPAGKKMQMGVFWK